MVERPLIFGPISLPVCLGCLKTLPLKKVLKNCVSRRVVWGLWISSKDVMCSLWFVYSVEMLIKQKRVICDDHQKVFCALCGWPMCSAGCSQRSPHARLECRLFRFLSWHKAVLMLILIFQVFHSTAKYSWEWVQKVLPSKRILSWLTPASLQSGLFFQNRSHHKSPILCFSRALLLRHIDPQRWGIFKSCSLYLLKVQLLLQFLIGNNPIMR